MATRITIDWFTNFTEKGRRVALEVIHSTCSMLTDQQFEFLRKMLSVKRNDQNALLGSMTEFILETNYPSRRIIRQTDNSSKYNFEDEC